MSNPESFIEEVNEEVRSERLFALIKKYGWIAVLLVVVLVGGAAYNEWKKSTSLSSAQELGDAITAALEEDDPAARRDALGAINAEGSAQAIVALLAAGQTEGADKSELAAQLDAIATNGDIEPIYRDIAAFKSVLLASDARSAEDRKAVLDGLAKPGAPLRLLAREQLAMIEVEQGNADAALDQLQAILQDAEVTTNMQRRLVGVIQALGGDIETLLNSLAQQ